MSASLQAPLMSADRAAKLLDEVIYARVRECIDLEGLLGVELDLWAMLVSQCGTSDTAAKREARVLVDSALARFAVDDDRYGPLAYDGECELCDEEARSTARERLRMS